MYVDQIWELLLHADKVRKRAGAEFWC